MEIYNKVVYSNTGITAAKPLSEVDGNAPASTSLLKNLKPPTIESRKMCSLLYFFLKLCDGYGK